MHIGVLPEVETGQVKPEDVHGFPQPGQPVVGQHRAAVSAQRSIDDVEVGQQLGRGQVALQAEVEFMFGLAIEDLGRCRGQAPMDDPQRAAVRLVGAGRLVHRSANAANSSLILTSRADIDNSSSSAVISTK